MAQFSDNDINEAKRRVWEMRNRASHYIEDSPGSAAEKNGRDDAPPAGQSKAKEKAAESPISSLFNIGGDGDNSFIIILALIMILSKEGADNTLILALLYLLL